MLIRICGSAFFPHIESPEFLLIAVLSMLSTDECCCKGQIFNHVSVCGKYSAYVCMSVCLSAVDNSSRGQEEKRKNNNSAKSSVAMTTGRTAVIKTGVCPVVSKGSIYNSGYLLQRGACVSVIL